jgi:hypothetical protein
MMIIFPRKEYVIKEDVGVSFTQKESDRLSQTKNELRKLEALSLGMQSD